jgi:hypothetical protein
MWYCDLIYPLLDNLTASKLVGEIILIDNNKSARPSKVVNTKKIRIVEQEQNIFVNPAWNLGVELSNYPNICISNDDLVWDVNVLPYILENLHLGIIGQSTSNYYDVEEKLSIKEIVNRPWGWGCCFWLSKTNWVEIPSKLKVACGDDWLIKYIHAWEITGLKLKTEPHPWSVSRTSSRREFSIMGEMDMEVFKTL